MNFLNETDFAITVCDENGLITFMNKKSIETFQADGGQKLMGTNVLDCHPEPSKTQLKGMLENRTKNVYTIEKKGQKKMIYQSPLFDSGEFKGFIELSLIVPEEMKHFKRD